MKKFFPVLPLVALAAVSQAQLRPGQDTLNFETRVGSFKILGIQDIADPKPASGKLTVSFSGTVLVSGLKGSLSASGNLRKEYEDKKHSKVLYTGTGQISLSGTAEGIQCFGRDIKAVFQGTLAFVRLYGEYDSNLESGKAWYGIPNAPKMDWQVGGRQFQIPMPDSMRPVVPKARDGK